MTGVQTCALPIFLVRGVVPESDGEVLCFGPFGENGSDLVVFLACDVDFVYDDVRRCLNSLIWRVFGEAECINLLVLECRLSSARVDRRDGDVGGGCCGRIEGFLVAAGANKFPWIFHIVVVLEIFSMVRG